MENKDLKFAKEDTRLATTRTALASTRTLLSYVRTTLVTLSLAFAFMKLDKTHPIDFVTITLFVMSGVFLIVGVADFFVTRKSISHVDDDLEEK